MFIPYSINQTGGSQSNLDNVPEPKPESQLRQTQTQTHENVNKQDLRLKTLKNHETTKGQNQTTCPKHVKSFEERRVQWKHDILQGTNSNILKHRWFETTIKLKGGSTAFLPTNRCRMNMQQFEQSLKSNSSSSQMCTASTITWCYRIVNGLISRNILIESIVSCELQTSDLEKLGSQIPMVNG